MPAPEPPPDDDHTLEAEFNAEWFFKDDTVCPACDATFDHLRVRVGAVRPIARASDFHSTYRTVDPLLYAVTVCPHCSFAAYAEEFGDVSAGERTALDEHRASRERLGRPNLCGERDLDGAAAALDLAIACYEVRAAGDRRRAGLLHRRAWIERTRGDEAAERVFLQQAVGAYRAAFEADSTINDTAAVRAAYLIGDLYMRLDDLTEASRWLASCLEMGGDGQSGIVRMAREQLHACRVRLEQRDKGAA